MLAKNVSISAFLLITFFSPSCEAQSRRFTECDPILEPNELQEDFEVFTGTLKHFHPALDWYVNSEDLNQLMHNTLASLSNPMSELKFYDKLARIVSSISCGHTRVWPSQKTSLKVLSSSHQFPIVIKITDDKVYCFNSHKQLPPGSQIIAINGLSVDTIISLAFSRLSADGYATSKKRDFLERYFHDFFAYHIGLNEKYTLKYLNDANAVNEVTLSGISAEELDNLFSDSNRLRSNKNIELNFIDNTSALLSVRNFSDWKTSGDKISFKKETQTIFTKLDSAKTKDLIIDLRDNGGGADKLGLVLFSHLHPNPIVEFTSMQHKLRTSKYGEFCDLNNFQIAVMRAILKNDKLSDSTFLFKNFSTLKPSKPAKPQYASNVYIITNGRTFSTAADFCALMKTHTNAIFIGEETGGGYYGNSSWLSINATLPNSEIRLTIPTVKYTTNVAELMPFGRGTIPDIPVTPMIEQLLSGEDVMFNTTLQLLNSRP